MSRRFSNRIKAGAVALLAVSSVALTGCEKPSDEPTGTDQHNENNPERCDAAPDLPGCDDQSNAGGVDLVASFKNVPSFKM